MGRFDNIELKHRAARRGTMLKLVDRIRLLERYRPWAVGIGAAAAALAAFSRFDAGAVGIAMAISGAAIALIAAIAVAMFDYRKLELGTEVSDAEDRVETLIQLGRDLEAETASRISELEVRLETEHRAAAERAEHRQSMLRALTLMQETGERADLSADILAVMEAMLDAGLSNIVDAFGFDSREHWTLSVFRRQKVARSEKMVRQVARWWDRQAEKQPRPRQWKRGEGFTGYAWAHESEVIEADATDPEVAMRYRVPEPLPTDPEKYVSVISIPIMVGEEDRVWGVITVTSNKAGRFQRNPKDIRSQNVDVVRQMERIFAVQIAMRDRVRKTAPTVAGGT